MKSLHRITIIYLLLPFIIFCFGWLRLIIALPVAVIILWNTWKFLQKIEPVSMPRFSNSWTLISFLLLTGLWVFFSGVGGYAFQNWDHHGRNAIFRDLIQFEWPVYYAVPETGPIKMLVYYVGYWLPAALTGKLFGWGFANFILLLWTWLGVVLVALYLGDYFKISVLKAVLFFIFFSGMDSLGTLLFANEYPTLFPPITHLEIWSGNLQYSSFTTQLFWVFNQAVPAWLCCVLIMDSRGLSLKKQENTHSAYLNPAFHKILIWSLCFFFAPLASIGLFPYLIIEIFKQKEFKALFKNIRFDILFTSGLILLISYLYFSANSAAQERSLQNIPLKDFLTFFLLEGGILWLFLAPVKWRDPVWLMTGFLLFVIPFIQLGNGRDFVMRASIAPLFYLMLMTGETVFQTTNSWILRLSIYVLLLIGALTPLYEINRSIYRTYEYYFMLDESQQVLPVNEPVTHLAQPGALEFVHPGSLTADDMITLKFMTDELSRNYIANVRQTIFYKYLASR